MVRYPLLPWIIALVIALIVAVVCRFIEEGPRQDEPPDTGEDGRAASPAAA